MPKTVNLGLEITTNNSELFQDWRNFINGDSNESMAKILDAFAGTVLTTLNNLWGVSGVVTIDPTDWTEQVVEVIFEKLGINDAIILSPTTIEDKTNIENANLFVDADGSNVIFTVETTPEVSISFNYFITRGKSNE